MNLKEVFKHYNEPHRHYHNLTHIRRIFDLSVKMEIELTDAQRIAILFHDIIYNTSSSTNEEDSVIKMRELCQSTSQSDEDDLDIAENIIVNTKKHISNDPTIAIVLDLDLAELGADWNRYIYNEQNIRKEYSDAEWKFGRAKFLESMLDRQSIFNTELFKNRFENVARDNIISSLSELGEK